MDGTVQAFSLGVLLGLTIAVPVGPMALLAVQHTLARGLREGLFASLGAATGDTLYALTAALGLTLVTASVTAHRAALQLGGGALLIALGALALRGGGARQTPLSSGPLPAYLAGLLLTITNPITVLTFGAILLHAPSRGPAAALAAGTFAGSFAWYAALCLAAGRLRDRLQRRLQQIQLAAIGCLWVGGAVSVAAAAAELWGRS
jgi:threonine/homoserine/homoserine lactone efflux protein